MPANTRDQILRHKRRDDASLPQKLPRTPHNTSEPPGCARMAHRCRPTSPPAVHRSEPEQGLVACKCASIMSGEGHGRGSSIGCVDLGWTPPVPVAPVAPAGGGALPRPSALALSQLGLAVVWSCRWGASSSIWTSCSQPEPLEEPVGNGTAARRTGQRTCTAAQQLLPAPSSTAGHSHGTGPPCTTSNANLSLPVPAGLTPAATLPGAVLLRPVLTAVPPPPPASASTSMEPCDPGTPPSHWERLASEEAADLLCDPDLDLVLELFAGPVPYLPAH